MFAARRKASRSIFTSGEAVVGVAGASAFGLSMSARSTKPHKIAAETTSPTKPPTSLSASVCVLVRTLKAPVLKSKTTYARFPSGGSILTAAASAITSSGLGTV